MLAVISYDVSTDTANGRKRLRRVAKICERYGQRVQKSVFECRVNQMQFEEIERLLIMEINENEDNLRLYRVAEHSDFGVKEYGKFKATDFNTPIII